MIKRISTIGMGLLLTAMLHAEVRSNETHSKVITDTIISKALDDYRQISVYLPRRFYCDTIREYPVLYLLHGLSDNHLAWPGRGHVQDVMNRLTASGEAKEMIIIMPEAGGKPDEKWNGYFNMPGCDYETFFFNELIPYVEDKYRIIPDRQHRAIAGLSMGGGGATSYALRHPGMFSSVYAMSALMNLPSFDPGVPENPVNKMGKYRKTVKDNDCVLFMENADKQACDSLKSINWFIDCGDDDFLFDCNIAFYQALLKAGIPSQLRVRDGGHDWEYWNSALYICLPFVSRGFGN